VDPSALIFVALAVAWAVYLIPKALEHHEESARTRTVDRFSATIRILGRREPISRRKARLVTTIPAPGPSTDDPLRSAERRLSSRARSLDAPAPLTAAQLRARRLTAVRAAKRRLRVVTLILVANAAVAGLAWQGIVAWVWCAVPVGVLAAWLVACRLMVRRERAHLPRRRIPAEPVPEEPKDTTEEIARIDAELLVAAGAERDPDSWDPVSVPLPTYVSKPVAPRSVSTIDLDSTGVWSSGRNASDSALAREADAAEAADRADRSAPDERRATGA
jgi:hypothetical protein